MATSAHHACHICGRLRHGLSSCRPVPEHQDVPAASVQRSHRRHRTHDAPTAASSRRTSADALSNDATIRHQAYEVMNTAVTNRAAIRFVLRLLADLPAPSLAVD